MGASSDPTVMKVLVMALERRRNAVRFYRKVNRHAGGAFWVFPGPLDWWSQSLDGKCAWRAVDSEGEVLEILVQPQRDKAAAVRLLRKLLRRQGFVPAVIITDKLRSYGAALREIGFSGLHEQGLRVNNRAGESHQPLRRRERKLQPSINQIS